jgi:HK97 gp10 family phage protein
MVTKAKLVTKGLLESLEILAEAGQDVDAAAEDMLVAGGEVLLAGMQQRVPKDTHNLEHHLVIDGPFEDGNYHYVLVGIPHDRRTDADTARYGNAQEYGTSSMPAQSYIRSTAQLDRAKVRKASVEALRARRGRQ